MIAQQKLGGVRVLVHISPTGELVATNRNGQPTQMAGGNALAGLAYLPKATVVDGEILDDAYWIFDVLQIAAPTSAHRATSTAGGCSTRSLNPR